MLQHNTKHVRPRDDHIFPEDPEECIEQSSTNHLANWLRMYRPTIFNSKKETEKLCQIISNELRGKVLFKTTEGYDKRHRLRERTKAKN